MRPPLPPPLENGLAALAGRVRRQRVGWGACRLIAAALVSGAAVLFLDTAAPLSVAVRCVLEVGWLGLVGFLAWRLAVRASRADVPLADLARRIERRHPELGERLRMLAGLAETGTGPARLVATLARDADLRARGVDLAAAVSSPAIVLPGIVVGVISVAATAALMLPGSGDALRRVALPWHRPAVAAGFHVVVTSGDAVVRRGESVTLAAYLEASPPGAPLPDDATLAVRAGPDAPVHRAPMTGDAAGAFHATRPGVADDFEYQVEVGPVASGWHRVLVAEPVELAGPVGVEITPPPYAAAAAVRHEHPAGTAFEGMQYATLALHFRFTRPAASAALDWRPAGRPAADTDPIPVELSPDRTGGTAAFRLSETGTLRVVLVNEAGPRKLRTETPFAVRVFGDAPPDFELVSGVPARPRVVRPGDRLAVHVVATDDVGVAGAELEYVVGADGAGSRRDPIPLTGGGTKRAEGRLTFDLAGKGKDGDRVRFRVWVTDARRVDDARLGPHEVAYPPAGWSEVTLADSAPPLDRQEIFGRRDDVRDALLAAAAGVRHARAAAASLRADTAGQSPLPVDHAARLGAIRDHVLATQARLRVSAGDTALTPALRPLAADIRATAGRQLHDADAFLRKAATDAAVERTVALDAAGVRLGQAAERLGELLRTNDALAQNRLDRQRLADLATAQADLTERAKTEGSAARDGLRKAQLALLTRLNEVLADSPTLKSAVDVAAGGEARRLAAEARGLAALVRDLDAAARQLTADARQVLLADLVRTQTELVDRVAALVAGVGTAARLAGVAPPDATAFRRAADRLGRNELVEAQTEVEKLAQSIDRTATEFDKWAAERRDAKAAARQLAAWQDDLRVRLAATVKPTPLDAVPAASKVGFRAEQRALLRSAERLSLPPDADTAALFAAAVVHLKVADARLAADGTGAEMAMKLAADALTRLAEKLPTVAERLARSRPELDKLRADQDAVAVAAGPLLRQFDKQVPDAAGRLALAKKFADLPARQRKLSERLAALDVPGLEARRARVVYALSTAATDLKEGAPDAAASLAWSKRELDRLRSACDRIVPADDAAAELALFQRELSDSLTTLGDRPTAMQLAPLAAVQQDVVKRAAVLVAPEAPGLLHDAREAVRVADAAFRGAKPADELPADERRRRVAAAAAALAALADRLYGREADTARVMRFVGARRRAAEVKDRGRPFNPDVSGEEKRRLNREAEELTHTRVGAAGQTGKQTVIELYARLQAKTEPDRDPTGQQHLADALDELAATMTGVRGLTTGPDLGPPAGIDPADEFLPSKSTADALRGVAVRQREVRERIGSLSRDLAECLRPSPENPLAALEARQRAFATAGVTFAQTLLKDSNVAAADVAGKAAAAARLAADRLRNGQVRTAKVAAEVAAAHFAALATAASAAKWGKNASALAADQGEIVATIGQYGDVPAAAAAQQRAWQLALGVRAAELALQFDLAAKEVVPGDSPAGMFTVAAESVRKAEKLLADSAALSFDAVGAMREEAWKQLELASQTIIPVGGMSMPLADDPNSAGREVRNAGIALRRAADEFRPGGNPIAVGREMHRASEALKRATISVDVP